MVGIVLFMVGIWGIVLNRGSIIIMLISIELVLLSVSYIFIVNSVALDNLTGQVFTIMVLTVGAAELGVGLSILVSYYRVSGNVGVKSYNILKG